MRHSETMPRERLAQLQLERLQATVTNAYDHVPLHRQRLQASGVRPADIRSLDDLALLPFTVKTDLRDQYPFGLFARPLGADCPAARFVGHHRQGHGGRLHDGRPLQLGRPGGALALLGRCAAWRRGAQRLRLRAFHRRAGRALRRRAPGRRGGAGVRRLDRAPGRPDHGFQRARAVRDTVLRAGDRRGGARAGRGPAQERAAHRHVRRRALERGDAPRDRSAASG